MRLCARAPGIPRRIAPLLQDDHPTRALVQGFCCGQPSHEGDRLLLERLQAAGCTPDDALWALAIRRRNLFGRPRYELEECAQFVRDRWRRSPTEPTDDFEAADVHTGLRQLACELVGSGVTPSTAVRLLQAYATANGLNDDAVVEVIKAQRSVTE